MKHTHTQVHECQNTSWVAPEPQNKRAGLGGRACLGRDELISRPKAWPTGFLLPLPVEILVTWPCPAWRCQDTQKQLQVGARPWAGFRPPSSQLRAKTAPISLAAQPLWGPGVGDTPCDRQASQPLRGTLQDAGQHSAAHRTRQRRTFGPYVLPRRTGKANSQ